VNPVNEERGPPAFVLALKTREAEKRTTPMVRFYDNGAGENPLL